MKKPDPENTHWLISGTYVTFWKRQQPSVREQIINCQGLEWKRGWLQRGSTRKIFWFFFLVMKLLHLDCGGGHRIPYISKTYSTIQRKQGRKEGGGKEERKFVVNLINLKIKKNFKKWLYIYLCTINVCVCLRLVLFIKSYFIIYWWVIWVWSFLCEVLNFVYLISLKFMGYSYLCFLPT